MNNPKDKMASWVSEISNDEAILNIRNKSKFPPGPADLISQLEVERMAEQAEKRAREWGGYDLPSNTRTVLGSELPEGARSW